MRTEEIYKLLKKSIKEYKFVELVTRHNKKFVIIPSELEKSAECYSEIKLHYFINKTFKKGQIYLKNIIECKIIQMNQKDRIEVIRDNYIQVLKDQEKDNKNYEDEKDFKEKIFNEIFEKIKNNKTNLLYKYIMGNTVDEKVIDQNPMLLLQKSNLSQKKAIRRAIEHRVSIIEGPPGTGKTTTILSIIANMIVRDKKVVVVSKNNSAIQNIIEELDNIDLPSFYIRLGNKEQEVWQLDNAIKAKEKFRADLARINICTQGGERLELELLIKQIEEKEEILDDVIKHKNKLIELENQYRHVQKLEESYSFNDKVDWKTEVILKRRNINEIAIDKLSKYLIEIEKVDKKKESVNWKTRIYAYFVWFISIKKLRKNGIAIQNIMERKYLEAEIEKERRILENAQLEKLQEEISRLYKEYNIQSKKKLCRYLVNHLDEYHFDSLENECEEKNEKEQKKAIKKYFTEYYPLVLTTADAVLGNYYINLLSDRKVDCLIIDESSQCDIVSGIPLLFLAEKIVVVGDEKQLSAITDGFIEREWVPKEYRHTKNNFLRSVKEVFHPIETMLLEHYRCDYQIINFCNKFFYDNELIVYTNSNNEAMKIVNADKGKYVRRGQDENGRPKSFINERENYTVQNMVSEKEHTFVITPFKENAKKLQKVFGEERSGTIHTFQGKGDKIVYFTTVLNDIQEARNHLENSNCLFNKELINVAVSRAKEQFILVTDKAFFEKNSENVKNLIEYIEAYGSVIEDKTVCIFDYLYKKMPTYEVKGQAENPFEEELEIELREQLDGHKEYEMYMKLPLANLVTDSVFLNENPDIYQFILNNSHVDYVIYDIRVDKPLLVIELDGKYHLKVEQIRRDKMKDKSLTHMGIKVVRISSKAAVDKEMIDRILNMYVYGRNS